MVMGGGRQEAGFTDMNRDGAALSVDGFLLRKSWDCR
jgi:hypothetical protein